jgi:ureidoglycolate hydrolase
MTRATTLPAVDWIMDHRVLGLRDGAASAPSCYLSWYTFAYTRLGPSGNLAFFRVGSGAEATFVVFTDSTALYEGLGRSIGPGADRERYHDRPPILAEFTLSGLSGPHLGTIEGGGRRIVATWTGLGTPLFAAGPSPARPESHETHSVLFEAATATITVDGAQMGGSPYRNDIWMDWLGRPLSSALVAIGEVVARTGVPSTTVPLRSLVPEALAPFGSIEATAAEHRELDEGRWRALATELIGGPVETRTPRLTPHDRSAVDLIEVHHASPQLTMLPDADWCLMVFPPGWTPDGDLPGPPTAFRVAAGTLVTVNAGVWHAPVTPAGESPAFVAFREGTLRDGSAVANLNPPLELAWS